MITSYFSKWQRNYIALGIPREKEREREKFSILQSNLAI